MQANMAIAFVETSSIARGVLASDVMCKMAEVRLERTAVIARGKYIIWISGEVAEVESALRAGLESAGDTVVHHVIIRNVHEQVLAALEKKVRVEKLEAVGVIETRDAAAAVDAADAAAKAARIQLMEVKFHVGGGKGCVNLTGEVGAVRSAVAAGIKRVPEGMLVSHIVIPYADPQLLTSF